MPRGSKKHDSSKPKRMTSKVEQSARKRGRSNEAAERNAGATVNERTSGGKKQNSP